MVSVGGFVWFSLFAVCLNDKNARWTNVDTADEWMRPRWKQLKEEPDGLKLNEACMMKVLSFHVVCLLKQFNRSWSLCFLVTVMIPYTHTPSEIMIDCTESLNTQCDSSSCLVNGTELLVCWPLTQLRPVIIRACPSVIAINGFYRAVRYLYTYTLVQYSPISPI